MADEAQLKVRLLRSLKAKVDAAAYENRRTLNAEIVARLERTFIEDAEREAATDARSKLAAQRVLSANLTGWPDPVEERLLDLENRVAALEGRKRGKG